jgi:PilZ domain
MAQSQGARITCSQCNGWYDSERELWDHIQAAHRRFFSEQTTFQHGEYAKDKGSGRAEAQAMTERRTARRYELSLPVNISIPAQTAPVSYKGRTSDISTRGVHFISEKDLKVGDDLDLTVTLLAELTGGAEVLVQTRSTVIRVEKRSGYGNCRVGVAASFKRYEIVRCESART